MGKVIITGANGLIGSHIAEYFLSEGIRPVCMIRETGNAEFLKSLGLDIVYGDVTDLNKLICIFNTGIDFVIHTAAKVADWGEYDDFHKVNVDGTLNVLKAANRNKIKDVIITGSISCYGEENNHLVKDENYPYHSHYNYFLDILFPSAMNFYRDTKAEAVIRAIEYAEENSINLTILEPAWVYGEREFHSGFYDFLKMIKSGLPVLPGSTKNKFHTIYARDLAKIYYLAYMKKLQGVNKILAVDPHPEYQYKLFDLFCEKAGYKPPCLLPKWITYLPGLAVELFYISFGIKSPPPLSRARVNIFYDNIEYSSEKVVDELGFIPGYSLEDGIANTVRWYKENKYL